MAQASYIVDSSGRPFALPDPRRASASLGGMNPLSYAYEAASLGTQEMGSWNPVIRSPDSEINIHRDRMVARSRDLVRNDGWAAGGILRILDSVVGAHLRLSARPDYIGLQSRFGKGFDKVWAEEFRRVVEARWRGYEQSLGRWNDVERKLTVGQQFRLALRHKLVDGESLMLAYWLPERVGYGGADYATAFQVMDPDRLSNPYQALDTRYMRGGVELDDYGVAQAYHIRKAEQNDWYNAYQSMTWERVEREDEDGWQRVFHDFEVDRAGQHRGVGVFAPVIERMKMLARYYGVELQAATLAAQLGLFTKSPYDPALIQGAIEEDDELNAYQKIRAEWAEQRPASFQGVRIPTLAPGESIESVSSPHPHGNFEMFAHEMLRTFAATAGISAEQVTQDWSKTNYSSARAALMEAWKTLSRRGGEFKQNTATPMYALWLREDMERGELPLPKGAPPFVEAASAYARCVWLGPPRGWVDMVKEAQGAQLRMDAGMSTLQHEAAEQGQDWEEVIEQRAIEIEHFKAKGLDLPSWASMQGAQSIGEAQDEPRSAKE